MRKYVVVDFLIEQKKIFDRFSRPLNSESRFRIGIGKFK